MRLAHRTHRSFGDLERIGRSISGEWARRRR